MICDATGGLFDTRAKDWSKGEPIRTHYCQHFPRISTVAELKATLRAGEFMNLGGYPLYFISEGNEPLSFKSVRDNLRLVFSDIADCQGCWRVVATDVNYEDTDLHCAHSGEPIPAAYGD